MKRLLLEIKDVVATPKTKFNAKREPMIPVFPQKRGGVK